jgi:N-dimethylarginine dimethylaminohydrolase
MGKDGRKGEPGAAGTFLESIGVPILGAISGEGRLEGGDVVWLDERTLAIGEGYRTNAEGIRQLESLISDLVDELIVVPLPHWEGPGDVLHLMSMISPVSHDCAVVYSRMMPVIFRQRLLNRGMNLVEVSDEEYDSMACNILAIAPGRCLMLSGNPQTSRNLSEAGVEVTEYNGFEISRKGAGGPTCLTRPLLRQS